MMGGSSGTIDLVRQTPTGSLTVTGSVTITAADSTRMTGIFQVTSFVSTGGSLTGSFDVPFDIVYP
jgi:hypothetical protein